jgi:hypothetical protein
MSFRVKAQNTGAARWRAATANGDRGVVKLGAHLLGINEEPVIWDYWRAELPNDIQPDESASISIALRAPDEPGDYIVEFDMVIEYVSWFRRFGDANAEHRVKVTGP